MGKGVQAIGLEEKVQEVETEVQKHASYCLVTFPSSPPSPPYGTLKDDIPYNGTKQNFRELEDC